MTIFVIIVTYNNVKTIELCLNSLFKQLKVSFLTLVIDNGSSDGTQKIIRQYQKIRFIQNKNTGFAGGNNLGIRYALKSKADYILILNPDVILDKNCLGNLVKAAKTNKDLSIIGPKLFTSLRKDKIWSFGGILDFVRYSAILIGFGKKDTYKNESNCEFISGTCMLMPFSLVIKGIKFEEKYFMYYEDVEFCLTAQKLGFSSHVTSEAYAIHLETSNVSKSKNYYLARNHLLFIERNAPFRVQLHEFVRLPKTLLEHYQKQEFASLFGIGDYFLRKFGRQL